jgi:hypothetical protein
VRVGLGDGPDTTVRMHYLDERPGHDVRASGETVLLLHDNPSWSYLYRHVIPPLVGCRNLEAWMAAVDADDQPALHSFVVGLRRDQDAVAAGRLVLEDTYQV